MMNRTLLYRTLALLAISLATLVGTASAAAPTLTTPTFSNVGANQVTLNLKASATGTGYFTLLSGSGAACGTGTQVKAGQTSAGGTAPYHGSLPLTADSAGAYTLRNLTQSTAYTACFTADDGSTLQAVPVAVNISTSASVALTSTWQFLTPWLDSKHTGTYINAGNDTNYDKYLDFAPDGTPYVLSDSYWGPSVKRLSGTGWDLVADTNLVCGFTREAYLEFAPNGNPYVATQIFAEYATVLTPRSKDLIMPFLWPINGYLDFSSGLAERISLAIAPDGTPYAAYQDATKNYKATVYKTSGGSWVSVGTEGFSAGQVNSTSLAIAPDGAPYVAYQDGANSNKATVMKFNGSSWVVVGSAGFSGGQADYTKLAIAPDGTLYVAYRDGSNGNKATVRKFNGASWVVVGNTGFSAGQADYLSLAITPDAAPVVAYEDWANNRKATVMKFVAGSWVTLGSAGFSPAEASHLSLAIAPDGSPYVAFHDGIYGYGKAPDTGLGGIVTVMKLAAAGVTTTTVTSDHNPATVGTSVTFTAAVTPAAASGTVTFSDGLSVLGSSTLSGGLAAYSTTGLIVGSHPITASYGGDSAYVGSTSAALTQTTSKSNQTITFAGPGTQYVGTNPTLTASASSLLNVSFTTATAGVCTVTSGGILTFGSAGTCTINADQNGNSSYNAASRVTQSFSVVPKNGQTITFANPGVQTVGTTVNLTATATSGLPVSFTSTTPGVCTVTSGGALSLVATGTCAINANQSGNGSYSAASQVGQSFSVDLGIILATPVTGNLGANQVTLNLTSSRTGTGYFTLLSGSGAACGTGQNVKDGKVSGGAAMAAYHGSLPLTANITGSYTVRNLSQSAPFTICFTADDNTTLKATPATAGITTAAAVAYTASNPTWNAQDATGFSNGELLLSISQITAPDGTPYVAYCATMDFSSFYATVKKFNGVAWEIVGSAGFAAISPTYTNPTFAIAPDGAPYLAFSDGANDGKATVMKFTGTSWVAVGGAGFSESATVVSLAFAPDGAPWVAYQNGSSKATVKKFDGTSWGAVGTAGFSADTVSGITLAFAPDGAPWVLYGDGSLEGKATVNRLNGASWDAVGTAGFTPKPGILNPSLAFTPEGTPSMTYAYSSSGANMVSVMTYSGGAWNTVGTDGTVITSISIFPINSNLSIAPDGTPWNAYQNNDNVIDVRRFSSGDWNTVAITTDSVDTPSLYFSADGTPLLAYMKVSFDGDGNPVFSGVSAKLFSAQTITFANPGAQVFATTPTLTATATSGLPVTFTSNTPGVCTISTGGLLNFVSVGDCTINADQAGNGHYNAAAQVTQTFSVTQATAAMILGRSKNSTTVGESVTFTAIFITSRATGSVTFKDGATTLGSGVINSGSATFTTSALSAGSHSITAVYGGDSNHTGVTSTAVTQTVLVNVTFTTSVPGLNVLVDGVSHPTPYTVAAPVGNSLTISVAQYQNGLTGTRYAFNSWSDSGAQSHSITVPATAATYTASLDTQYQINVQASPPSSASISLSVNGVSQPITSAVWYPAGTQVTAQAFPTSPYLFSSWSGGATGSVNPVTVTANGPLNITAVTSIPSSSATLTPGAGITKSGATAADRTWSFTLSNSSYVDAANVQVSLTLTATPACVTQILTPMPVSLGTIAQGGGSATANIHINFGSCPATTKFAAKYTYTSTGSPATAPNKTYNNQFQ